MLLDTRPLRHRRDYRLLFIGQTVSFFGSMITSVAIPVQVYRLTGSSAMVGMIGIAQLVPLSFAALWGGAYADAMDRRRLLVGAELLLACGALLFFANTLFAQPSVPLIFAVTALMSAVNGFHRPTLEAMTQKLIPPEELTAVAALGSLKYNLGAIGGPALAGLLIAKVGLEATFALDALTYGISLVALARMQPMQAMEEGARPDLRSIAEGLRYALTRPELIGTYVVDIVAMTFAMPMALFPAMADAMGGESAVGFLYPAMSLGSLLLTLFSGWTSRVRRHGLAVLLAAAAWGVAITALGFVRSLPLAVVCLAVAGGADMVSGLFRMTIWNTTIPPKLRGRLAGVEMLSYMTGPLLGNARAGWVASVTSVAFSIYSGGVLCVIGVFLCGLALPLFLRYEASQPKASSA